MNQIPINDWPVELTEEVAALREEPKDLERNGSIKFEETYDDLDYFKAAIVQESGVLFALKQYRNSPDPGVSLWVPRGPLPNLIQFIDAALRILNLNKTSIKAMRSDLK